jgi:hypothetical protein
MERWTIGTGGTAICFETIYSSLSVKLFYYYNNNNNNDAISVIYIFLVLNLVRFPWTLHVFESPSRNLQEITFFLNVHLFFKNVLPPGMPMRQIHSAVIFISSEAKYHNQPDLILILILHHK